MRRSLAVVVAFAAAIACSGAFAASADKEQHKFNAADQASAKKAVIARTDLGTTGWSGGAKAPDLTPPTPCANWNPKQSDLVLTGAAESSWKHSGLALDSEVQILQSKQMVALDWQRTVADPNAIKCTEATVKKNLASGTVKFISYKRIAFPHVGTYSRAYLTTVSITSNGQSELLDIEDVLIGAGRAEITLSSTTPAALQAAVASENVVIAKKLVTRATSAVA
jgi:hypothetical protein